MVNQEINEKLVRTANIERNDLVLEIGPGTGSLTNYLVEAGAHVIAVEKVRSSVSFVRRFISYNILRRYSHIMYPL
jgi:16S rRNA A1518/A1519 N6-dimethyltransferase RsmA/KsgA/DIM1 with predicted DNA glycosylase/AP lyase activity